MKEITLKGRFVRGVGDWETLCSVAFSPSDNILDLFKIIEGTASMSICEDFEVIEKTTQTSGYSSINCFKEMFKP